MDNEPDIQDAVNDLPLSSDNLIEQFRAQWRKSPITVESFLDKCAIATDVQTQHMARLIKSEIELRRAAGTSCSTSDYQERFPNIAPEVIENLFSLPAPPPASVLKPLLPRRYVPIKEIGKGGIGSVWEVSDKLMDRKLAVKVLHPRFEKIPSANLRLKREATLTGSLQHPGIPPVFEYGSLVSGSHYFAMKLVEGETLDKSLSNRSQAELLSIFRQIAEAVGFAHSKNVIHRDLKPQNVMVGAFGEVQIMDWGMARRMDINEEPSAAAVRVLPAASQVDTVSAKCDESVDENDEFNPRPEFTREGEVMGTPAYMSPEQARGEVSSIDARSDVFGLGAILFSLLTGKRLYQGQNPKEMIAKAARCDLTEAFETLDRSELDEELKQLCRDCIQPQIENRPLDATIVADRISEYQNDVQLRLRQAELDKRASAIEAKEQRKRRRAVTWLSSLVILATTAGLLGVIWNWRNATNAEKLAVERLADTRATVDDFYTTIAKDTGLLAETSGTQKLRKELLTKAKNYYVNFISDNADDESTWLEMAKAYDRLIEISAELDPGSDEVFVLIGQQKELLQKLIHKNKENEANPEFRKLLFVAQNQLASELFAKGEYEKAIKELETCGQLGDDWIAIEDSVDARIHCAKNRHNIGDNKEKLKRHKEAIEEFTEALKQAEPLWKANPDNERCGRYVAVIHNSIGVHFGFYAKENRDWQKSVNHFVESIEILDQLIASNPDELDFQKLLPSVLNNLGMAHWNNKKKDDLKERTALSTAAFDRGISITRDMKQKHPDIPYFSYRLAKQLGNLAQFQHYLEDPQAELEYTREAVEVACAVSDRHPQVEEYAIKACQLLDELASLLELCPESADVIKKSLSYHARLVSQSNKVEYQVRWALRKAVVEKTLSPMLLNLTDSFDKAGPKSADLVIARALALFRNEKLDEAKKVLDKYKRPKKPLYKFVKGVLLAKAGEKELAQKLMTEGQSMFKKETYSRLYYYRLLLANELKSLLSK